MKAIVIERFGEPEVLAWRAVPDPQPGPDDLLVRVRAAGLNRADCLQRLGHYPAPPGVPGDIPGLEFAGEIVAVGRSVRGWRVGDRAMGIVGGGAHAELVAIDHRMAMPIPERLETAHAAALPEAFIAAWDALVEQAGLRAGCRVLVSAAASGVGSAALQLIRAAGATAIGMSRDAERRSRLAALGAACAVDPTDPQAAADAVLAATGGDGVEVVLDLVGAPGWPIYERCLAERGVIIVVGLLGGRRVEFDLARLLGRRWRVQGTILRSRPRAEKIELVRRFTDGALRLIADGALVPVVDRVVAIERSAEAHRLMQSNAHVGKIVLSVGS